MKCYMVIGTFLLGASRHCHHGAGTASSPAPFHASLPRGDEAVPVPFPFANRGSDKLRPFLPGSKQRCLQGPELRVKYSYCTP